MSQPTPTPKPVKLTDLMTPEEQERVARRAAARIAQQDRDAITEEWASIAELGYWFGWPAVSSFFNDEITISQANELVKGARRIHSGVIYDHAVATFAGSRGDFQKLMTPYLKKASGV